MNGPDPALRTVDEHLRLVLDGIAALPPQRVPLRAALGLVAAQGARSLVDLPGFANSAMDGYAVRAADVASASPEHPVLLEVVDDLPAGSVSSVPLGDRQAIRIMTGAMIPAGADAVVKVEDTDAGLGQVAIHRGAPVGTSIRARGEDLATGGEVLTTGTRIDARRIALLAAGGHGQVLVHPRPRVAVLSTGAELVEPGEPLAPGQIHDSNSHMLAAAVTEAGGVTAYQGSVGDHPGQVRELLARLATEVDLIVTSGGVSMGAHDVVKAVLRGETGLGSVEFVQVAMQPGKPQGFGRLGAARVPFFGLPGNPVSSYVSFEVFVRPVLRRMLGREPAQRATVTARLLAPLRSPAGKRQIGRGVAQWADGQWTVEPVAGQGSHFVADLARSDCFVIVPEQVTALAAGDSVQIVLLTDWREDHQ